MNAFSLFFTPFHDYEVLYFLVHSLWGSSSSCCLGVLLWLTRNWRIDPLLCLDNLLCSFIIVLLLALKANLLFRVGMVGLTFHFSSELCWEMEIILEGSSSE